MELCEGNWVSAIRWEKKKGHVVTKEEYAEDGTLHVCPYDETTVRVTYIRNKKSGPVLEGTCNSLGEKERFKLEFERTDDNDDTYHYVGYGRVLNDGNGPAVINGRVTVTAEGIPAGGDEGMWEAVRIGGHDGRPGGHEGSNADPSQTTTTGTGK
ncbi:MAG TPA: hypothetical protein VKB12_15755 [Pyrinomonadaceae bacterium]|nr:hypothetical protein [Pyrinomonadaceae bacterium]